MKKKYIRRDLHCSKNCSKRCTLKGVGQKNLGEESKLWVNLDTFGDVSQTVN